MLFRLFLIGLFLIGCTSFEKSEVSDLKKLSQIEIVTDDEYISNLIKTKKEGIKKLIDLMPSDPVKNQVYLNKENFLFEEVTDKIGFNMIQVYVLPNTKIVHSIDATKYIGVKWENVDDLKQVLDEKYGRRNLQEMEYYGWTKCYSSWWDEESSTTIMISYEKRRIKLPAEYSNLTVRYEHTKLSDKVWQEKYKKEQEENKKRIDSIKGNF